MRGSGRRAKGVEGRGEEGGTYAARFPPITAEDQGREGRGILAIRATPFVEIYPPPSIWKDTGPQKKSRALACRLRLETSMVSMSITLSLRKPERARSFSSSQPRPPAPTTCGGERGDAEGEPRGSGRGGGRERSKGERGEGRQAGKGAGRRPRRVSRSAPPPLPHQHADVILEHPKQLGRGLEAGPR